MANVNNNTSIDQLEEMYDNMEELQGYGADDSVISYHDYASMTEEEREAYLEMFIAQAELTSEEAAEIEEALSEKLDSYHDMLREARAYLEQLVGDENADASLKARSQVLLEDVNELIEGTDAKDFSADWGESLDAVEERNQTIETRGTTTNVNTDNAEHGDVYTVDATKMEDSEGAAGSSSYFDDYENAQEEQWAWNEDTNGDGIIDKTDNPDYNSETPTTINLSDIPSDAEVTASVEEGDPTVITLHVVEADGTEYEIQLILDQADIKEGNVHIILGAVPTNVDDLPKEINGVFYEKMTSEKPYSHYTHDYRPSDNETSKVIVNMREYYETTENTSYDYEATQEAFNQSEEVTIDCNTTNSTINIDVESYEEMYGEEISVSLAPGDEDGEIVITLTTESGKTITITVTNMNTHGHFTDRINITGGNITTSEEDLQKLLKKYSNPGGNDGYYDYIANNIKHNGSKLGDDSWPAQAWAVMQTATTEDNVDERAADAGYNLHDVADEVGMSYSDLVELVIALVQEGLARDVGHAIRMILDGDLAFPVG